MGAILKQQIRVFSDTQNIRAPRFSDHRIESLQTLAAAKDLFYGNSQRFKDEHFILLRRRVMDLLAIEKPGLRKIKEKHQSSRLNTSLIDKLNEMALLRVPYIFS